ncbi:unnamed protein product [Thelazia callipaeda]|uniref:CC2D2AN-C2 domain-containing protein n=1 Tax=Thelazia callipaeda TaxID=103827 RepID=A0A0N5CWA4_THECL|nr:unnamed protein product [Thelazia callipaeda]
MQLDIDLNRIVFNYHWLFGSEDLNLHKTQSVQAQEALELLKEIDLEERKLHYEKILQQDEMQKIKLRITELTTALQTKQQNYLHLSDQIEQNWCKLQSLRHIQKYSTTTLTVKKTTFEQQQHIDRFISATFRLDKCSEVRNDVQTMNVTDRSEMFSEIRQIPVHVLSNFESHKLKKPIPKDETDRMNYIQKCRLQLQIEFNKIVVCKTLYQPLDNHFQAYFGQIYSLQVRICSLTLIQVKDIPESVTITIFEKVPKTDARKIAVVGLPLPDENHITEGCGTVVPVQFASDLVIEGMYSSLGSGNGKPCIAGELYCNAFWAKGAFKANKLHQFPTFTFKQQSKAVKVTDFIPEEVRLCTDQEFNNDIRLQALQHRSKQKNEMKKLIPLLSSEMEHQISDSYENEASSQFSYKAWIDKHRSTGHRYATMIRNLFYEKAGNEQRVETLQGLVHEEPIPTFFNAFSSMVISPIMISRKLRPTRRMITKRQITNDVEYSLVINIQSALNLPEPETGKLFSFVVISFQGLAVKTFACYGQNANWQHTVELKLDRVYNQNNDLKKITDSVHITVYDQVLSKLDQDDREPNSVHEQLEIRWLGSLSIPFSTIYYAGKIDGTLQLQTPLFLTSYRYNSQPTYLKLLIAFQPAISPLKVNLIKYVNIHRKAMEWEQNATNRFPGRRYISIIQSTTGKRVLACRFLRPIKPPTSCVLDNNDSSPRKLAHTLCQLVSCIPFLEDAVNLPKFCDVWTTVDQFMQIGYGSEEHAILLCCWLLHFHIPSYVLLGESLLQGPRSTCVLAMIPEGAIILNASYGTSYNINDPLCPIISIGTVITIGNHYANIQQHEHPSQMQFDFTVRVEKLPLEFMNTSRRVNRLQKRNKWLPMFNTNQTELESIQPKQIVYLEMDKNAILQLRTDLEREIRLKFDQSRQYGIPQWNLLASRMLRELLTEQETLDNIERVNYALMTLRTSYHVNAVAFRERYTNSKAIIDKLLSLKMQENSDASVQFAVAIHLHPFVNNILSCSVAIAALKPLVR